MRLERPSLAKHYLFAITRSSLKLKSNKATSVIHTDSSNRM